MSNPEVITAIPTYNSPEMAMAIGESLLEHGVPHAFILDDSSRKEEASAAWSALLVIRRHFGSSCSESI